MEFFFVNIIVRVLYIGILQTVYKNNISVKRYCILKIGYLNKTLYFGLKIAFSNCYNSFPKSAIEICFFREDDMDIFKSPYLLL